MLSVQRAHMPLQRAESHMIAISYRSMQNSHTPFRRFSTLALHSGDVSLSVSQITQGARRSHSYKVSYECQSRKTFFFLGSTFDHTECQELSVVSNAIYREVLWRIQTACERSLSWLRPILHFIVLGWFSPNRSQKFVRSIFGCNVCRSILPGHVQHACFLFFKIFLRSLVIILYFNCLT